MAADWSVSIDAILAAGRWPADGMNKENILTGAAEYLIPGRVKTLKNLGFPVILGRREGYYIWDADGRELMDFHLNGGTFNIGHRNPQVIEMLGKALEVLDIGNHHFPSMFRVDLAEKLARLAPGGLQYTIFTSGGGEANDIAIKSARITTGRRKIVAVDAAYHGRTGLSGAAGDDEVARYFLSDEPADFIKVPFNDQAAMEKALCNNDVAAVLMETIPATCGFPVPDPSYLPHTKRLCKTHGTLYIADEVQTGLGRTGHLWGVEKWGVEPDILVVGKGLSGGIYPMAAAVLSSRAGAWLDDNPWGHVSTFGGAELGCPIASLVLDMCSSDETLGHVREIAGFFGDGLKDIQSRHSFLIEIRQTGLVMGLKFDNPVGGIQMSKALYENGIWAMFSGFDPSVLQFKPGIFVDRAYCTEALERLERALLCVENTVGDETSSIANPGNWQHSLSTGNSNGI